MVRLHDLGGNWPNAALCLMGQTRQKKVLERGRDSLSIDAPVWADMLLLALNWGWKPSRPTFYFLGTIDVTEDEARSLASTIERIWDAAGKDPFGLKLKPHCDLGLLLKVGAFCLHGAFNVR